MGETAENLRERGEVSLDVSESLKILHQKFRRHDNYVPCEYCGATIYRIASQRTRNKHNFCSHSCQQLFYHHTIQKTVNWHMQPWLVSAAIAQALKTGEYP
jgi:hypothetical protein